MVSGLLDCLGNISIEKMRARYRSIDIKRLKDLEAENRKLKHMFANLGLEQEVQKDIMDQMHS